MIQGAEPFFLEPEKNKRTGIGILLIHGWTSSPFELKKLGEYLLEKGLIVSVPLLPGHGTVPEDLYAVGWDDWKESIENSYQELKKKTDKIFIGGVSMGGNLAIHLASDHPEIKGIITMGTPLFVRNNFLKVLLPILKRIHPMTNKSYPDYVRKEILEYKKHYWSFPTKSMQDTVDGMNDSNRNLHKVKCPALIMQSTRDYLLRNRNARVLFRKFGTPMKDKELVWVHDSDHVFIIDLYKEEIFAKIDNFIKNII
ncbi:alpha/beta fold hydrolase [bacterium]|nr:MAG: alpha/beta fold hydrolase [bacterium]